MKDVVFRQGILDPRGSRHVQQKHAERGRMSLDTLPSWSTTGIGSLPFIDPHAAAIHATASYEIPFRPQLPRLEGEMVSEWLGGEAEWGRWTPERKTQHPKAWASFLDEMEHRPPEHRWAKLQVTGPMTLAAAIDPDRPSLQLMNDLAEWLAQPMKKRVEALADRQINALLMIDEPTLDQFEGRSLGDLVEAWQPLVGTASAWGLHLCCEVPWHTVLEARPDVLSFDLSVEVLDEEAVEAIDELVASGCRMAWGIIRPTSDEGVREGRERLDRALEKVPAAGPGSMITAACGSGMVSPEREVGIAMSLRSISHSLRNHAAPGY